jgi:phage tail sheath gpL-like
MKLDKLGSFRAALQRRRFYVLGGVTLAIGALCALALAVSPVFWASLALLPFGTIIFDEIVPQLTPDVQIETDLTGQLSGLASGVKKTLLVGHATSAGTATDDVVYQIYGVNHAIELWGIGSDLAVMTEKFLLNSPRTPLYGMSYAEGAGVQATGVVTLATSATAAGVLTVWLCGQRFQVGIANTDTPTAVGDLLVAAVNAASNLPVTAANVTGVVTFTHRTIGPHGNSVRYRSEITSGIGMTSTDTGAVFTSGTVEGDPTAGLAAAEGDRYHLVVLNTYDDSVTLGVLSTDREKQSGVAVQKWGLGIVGHNGTPAEAQTLAGTDDSYRTQVFHVSSADEPSYWLAAAFAGLRAKRAANLPLDYQVVKGIGAPFDETGWPTSAEIEADIDGGVTPGKPLRSGDVQVVRSVITRQTAAIAFRDHQVAEISDFTDESIINTFRARLLGKPLKSGSPPGSPTTVTPERATRVLNGVLKQLDNIDYLQGVETSIDAGRNFAEVNASDPNRVDVAFDFWPIASAHFFAIKKTYITQAPEGE